MKSDDTTSEPSDVSLVRLANFVLRYRWLLIGLPVFGYFLVAGWTLFVEESRFRAAATVRAPLEDGGTLAKFEYLVTSSEVLASALEVDGSEGKRPTVLRLRERTSARREGDLVRLEFTSSDSTTAVAGLGRIVERALEVYRERAVTVQRDSAPAGTIAARLRSLVRAEQDLVDFMAENGAPPGWSKLRFGATSDTARLISGLLRSQKNTITEARDSYRWLNLRRVLAQVRDSARRTLMELAGVGDITFEQARSRWTVARDSLRIWLLEEKGAPLTAADRVEFENLVWRVELWEDVRRRVEAPSLIPVVITKPTLDTVVRGDPWREGILGLLAGGVIGLPLALIREAVRTGRARQAEEYFELQTLVSEFGGGGKALARWLRGDPVRIDDE